MTSAAARRLAIGSADISYTVAGSGPAVLMVQGVGVPGSGWQPQADALSSRFRVIIFDNRGLGGSTLGDGPLTIERMAADALAIVDAEGINRFHLVGHSMGGLIAQHVALMARPRLISLTLMCTFADGKDGSRLPPAMMIRAIRTRLGTRAMRRNAMLDLVIAPHRLAADTRPRLAAQLGALFGRDLADQAPVAMQQLRAMSAYGATQRLADLAGIPALVVSGAHDLIARPSLGRALADAIPGARYVEFADAGHALPIECAAAVNALLVEHLDAAERQHAAT